MSFCYPAFAPIDFRLLNFYDSKKLKVCIKVTNLQAIPNMSIRVVTGLNEYQLRTCLNLVSQATPPPSRDTECQPLTMTNSVFSKNEKGYIQIRVEGNVKVQLHQLIAWMHPDMSTRTQFRQDILYTELEISHLCNNKRCANPDHLWAESSAVNKSRNYCEPVVYINSVPVPHCRHHPPCIVLPQHHEEAIEYSVWKDVDGIDNFSWRL